METSVELVSRNRCRFEEVGKVKEEERGCCTCTLPLSVCGVCVWGGGVGAGAPSVWVVLGTG